MVRWLREVKFEMTCAYRGIVPWVTRGGYRDLCETAKTEKVHVNGALRYMAESLEKTVYELRQVTAERDGERRAKQKLETQRVEEHEALRRMMFGLSNGLETTLGVVDKFVAELPDYTPDQAERSEVVADLVHDELVAQEEDRPRAPEGEGEFIVADHAGPRARRRRVDDPSA